MLLNLIELVDKYKININGVIHIGAHWGQENSIYGELNIHNRIFFEPIKSNFEKLKENVGDGYLCVNKALGNDNKIIEMFVEHANGGQSSSVLEPKTHLQRYPHIQFPSKEEVDMVKLDDFNYDVNKYNFINIDVQGYELEVFKGASEKLNHIDVIMTEINQDELYKDCTQIQELDEFLSKYGFERVETYWWYNDGWGDALYIKKV